MKQQSVVVAIVGATGAVGTTLLDLFRERSFQFKKLHLVASPRSAGRSIEFLGQTYTVENLETFDFTGVDIAFFSAGTSVSRKWVGKAVEQGALVIDNTNAFRMDEKTPLVVPQVNRHQLSTWPASGVYANPNCATIPVVRALKPLDAEFGVKKVIISTYQAASGQGLNGIEELLTGSRKLLEDEHSQLEAKRFQVPLAFNLVPNIDVMLDTGFTLEEQKMIQESRKIMERSDLSVSSTAVRVPVVNCHSEAVYFECERPMSLPRMLELLREGEELQVYHGEGAENYPTPRTIRNPNDVHVGRIRVDPGNANAGWLWVVSDNLRVGAALNAIQIAEEVIVNGLLAKRAAA